MQKGITVQRKPLFKKPTEVKFGGLECENANQSGSSGYGTINKKKRRRNTTEMHPQAGSLGDLTVDARQTAAEGFHHQASEPKDASSQPRVARALFGQRGHSVEGGTHPSVEGGTHPSVEGGTHPSVEGGTHPSVEGGTHPSVEGGTHPSVEGGTHPSVEGGTHPSVEGGTHPSVEGGTHPSVEGGTHPSVEGGTHPSVEGGTHPSVEGSTHHPDTQPIATAQLGALDRPSCAEKSPDSSNTAAHCQQEVEDDTLMGLCPEDLDFTAFNCSKLSSCSGMSSPPWVSPTHLRPPCSAHGTPPRATPTSVASHSTPTKRPVVEFHDFFDLASFEMDLDIPIGTSNTRLPRVPMPLPPVYQASTAGTSGQHCSGGCGFYGLPVEVQRCLEKERGIKGLYEWQDACLRLESVSQGKNLIYSLPTSGGKTLVAEIIIFKEITLRKKDVLMILPYVSIVQEKVRDLLPFASVLGFAVDEYAGSKGKIPPRKRRRKHVVYVATIEKASGLANSLIEDGRMDSIGLVVVDELHMLGEGGVRGATLETCLAKIMFASVKVQIIGMSATLSNMEEVARFLKAEVYCNDFRPVELREYIKMGCGLYSCTVGKDHSVNFDHCRSISGQAQRSSDPDQLCSLVLEIIPHSSCLVFCPTKRNCQNVALLLSSSLPRSLTEAKRESRLNLLKILSIEASGVCPILAQTIPCGIAYHHSGLTSDERRAIEEAYLQGTLCLLTCTSTLAAGVNLPAKRVILRSPYVGTQLITHSQYKQMVGRAGRSGLSESGESILILQPSDKEKVVAMLSSTFDRCVSSLATDGSYTLHSLLLSLIGLKLVGTSEQLRGFLRHTLQCVQLGEERLVDHCSDALGQLASLGYITLTEEGGKVIYAITRLGKATYRGCLPVDTAHQTYTEGLKAQECLILSTDLHLLYLVTPSNLTHTLQPNWMVYFQTMTRETPDDLKVAEVVGVALGVLSKMATGIGTKMLPQMEIAYRRLYLALILKALLMLKTSRGIWTVADQFTCSRGFLQNTLNSVAAYVSCLVRFTEELPELWALHLLLPSLNKRFTHFACVDLAPLLEIPGVKQGRAQQLFSAGICTPQQLACFSAGELCDKVEHLYPSYAAKLIQAAKALVAEQVEALYDQAEELMDPDLSHCPL